MTRAAVTLDKNGPAHVTANGNESIPTIKTRLRRGSDDLINSSWSNDHAGFKTHQRTFSGLYFFQRKGRK
jgi:hypothetical protein